MKLWSSRSRGAPCDIPGENLQQPNVNNVSAPIDSQQAGALPVSEPHERNPAKVERLPGVCGGQACITGTRIPIYILEQYRRLGASDERLLDVFPTLSLEDVAAAWEYVGCHREEIDAQIARD
jgi:uncharacterized protein (DUF433 family)